MRIGILALQGAFIEHEKKIRQAGAEPVQVRLPTHLEDLDGLIIPGGESTTIGKLAVGFGLIEPLRRFASKKPTWGTCAGMIFLARDIGMDRQPILGVMNVVVNRNAFGRQLDSFEIDLPIAPLGETPFHAVFIRAPVVSRVDPQVQILAQLDNTRIVAVQEDHLLATAFHPELTNDMRFHTYFLRMVKDSRGD